MDIISMYGYGLTDAEIGDALGIAVKTVEYHRSRIYQIMHFNHLTQIVRTAIAFGMVSLCTLLCAAQTSPVTFIWNNPGPQYTNLSYTLYYQTNLAVPTNQWLKLATNIPPIPYGTNQLQFHTNLVPAQYYFTATAVDNFWHLESFFSQGASTPQPLTTPLLNLQILQQ
jgi:DNA-binding CsgD family transcriptional regulator